MATSSDTYPILENIEELDIIRNVLNNEKAQKGLIALYSASDSEFRRNGKLGPEVGRAREDDLKAVLHNDIRDEFNCNIDDNIDNGADCTVKGQGISIKHSSNAIGKGRIKVKWTSDESKARDCIKQMLLLEKKNYTHMLLIYIDNKKHTIQIIAISAEQILEAVKDLKEDAFKTSFGKNTRGIEYSQKMIQRLIKKKYFQIDISNAVLTGGIDPIKRRQLLLESVRPTQL
uniref:Restriction endonuclease n=1 Tax=viral metagenome TaxID=1070528 RepID=A0A6C0H1Z2_9ZZZZ